ncbi:alcohol dehydrogenase, propanol-preferring [Paraburkholderia caballeronis]|uniref:alcohol dehydrogenase n=2 Tax=Paraburkholderia caballeronis TaxID=416943 RepID=A0A1H7S6R5_9BURK|nr:propanol-preferring alcohol dehydrogenase [Paraburkholderia caballeronis]PXW97301.1 propanol-preferring alcohol dehydrogenase [Paraburkholderia caballeronis]RAJ93821.1 propanol-preferring alcohol dehydrogenase [Paraburkholderia caballeronis]SED56797.1 alcohol dehydrogenase, propanol-preferring [Paraburkholderia caballeronis]SEL68235.1 alcohol dehydrogenase, propanol-preferring [Paraburkholderia caballeronis]
MQMQCYCVTHHGQPLERVEKAVPQPQRTEVLLRVKAAGLCHSDLHIWEGYYDLGGGKKLSLADRGIRLPLTPSHEIAGEIVEAGPDAGDVEIGALVVAHPWIGCGECAACQRGEENLCVQPQSLGIMRDGGFADYVLVPHPRYLVNLGGLDPARVAPLACAGETTYSALKKFGARIHEGPVVVIGAGGLGLMAIEVLKALGGHGAIVVDVDAGKRDAALKAGALAAIDARAPDAAKQIVDATGGGARAVLDLVGATPTVTLALDSCARGGHVVIVGLMGGDITLSLPVIPMRPLKIEGSYVGTLDDLRELVALTRDGKMKPPVVTSRPLAEANDALQALLHGKVVGRTVLVP